MVKEQKNNLTTKHKLHSIDNKTKKQNTKVTKSKEFQNLISHIETLDNECNIWEWSLDTI